MVQITELKFLKPFSESYLRNNRSTGQKSLRCFPQCATKGHRRSGFCGDQLEATAIIVKNLGDGDDWLCRISVVGEIRPSSDQGISSQNKISRERLLHDLRDIRSAKIGGELILGEMRTIHEDAETAFVAITFNAERHSWDYSWKSNRWSGVINSHVVDVILVQSLSSVLQTRNSTAGSKCLCDDLDIYSSACSTTFLVLSSHKSSNLKRKQPAAPTLASANSTGSNSISTAMKGASLQLLSEHQSKWKESFSSADLSDADRLVNVHIYHRPFTCVCHNGQVQSDRTNSAIFPSFTSASLSGRRRDN